MTAPGCNKEEILSILRQRRPGDGLPIEMKLYMLDKMKETGALKSTLATIHNLQDELLQELRKLEDLFGETNSVLELLLMKLWI